MFGVDEQYRGKGVASELVQETINVAKSNGYKKVITESTGTISQGIFDKFGFKTLKEVEYKTYLYNSQPVFKDIKEQSCKLMERTFN